MGIEGQLLYTGYKFGEELVLDLYGEPADEYDGYHVMTATPTGTQINLADLLSYKQLEDMGYWLDNHMSEEAKQQNDEARLDSVLQDRAMCQNDHQWRQL